MLRINREPSYRETRAALKVASRRHRDGYLSMFHSPYEHAHVQYPTNRRRGVEPAGEYQQAARGVALRMLGSHEHPFFGMAPDRPSFRQFIAGSELIADYYGFPRYTPIFVPDPLERVNGQPPIDSMDVMTELHAADAARQIRRRSHKINRLHVIHFTNTEEAQAAQSGLGDHGIQTVDVFDRKSYKFPDMYDRSGFSDVARKYRLPIPFTRVISDPGQIDGVFDEVTSHSLSGTAYVKLSAGAGGYGVQEARSSDDAKTIWKTWDNLSMFGPYYGERAFVELQAAIPGLVEFLSFQYSRGHITTPRRAGTDKRAGAFTTQYQTGVKWEGNGFGVGLNIEPDQVGPVDKTIHEFQKQFMNAMRRADRKFTKQAGGVDFALVDLRQMPQAMAKELMGNMWQPIQKFGSHYGAVIVEHNGGRASTAAIPTIIAEQLQLVEKRVPFAAMKVDGVASQLPEVWRFLRSNGLQYDPVTRAPGVIPISWVYDPEYGIQKGDIMVVGGSQAELLKVRDTALAALEQEGLINKTLKLSSKYNNLPEYQ